MASRFSHVFPIFVTTFSHSNNILLKDLFFKSYYRSSLRARMDWEVNPNPIDFCGPDDADGDNGPD